MMIPAIKLSDFKFNKKETKILSLPIDDIKPNPYQPRKYFDKESLMELASSIKDYGVMQPINVRLINGQSYELVAGERRLRACKLAGLSTIPAIVINVNDNDSAVIALIENLQRQNLNFIEEAEGYLNLMNDYGLTQEELATKVGRNQSTVSNKLRILKLPQEVIKLLLEHNLTERHARALLKIPDEQIQMVVVYKVIDQDLNVKKTEELVEATINKIRHDTLSKVEQKVKRNFNDIRLITNTIRQSLDIIKKQGVEATYDVEEGEEAYEILIKIPYKA